MIKNEFIKMIKERIDSDKKFTLKDINAVLEAVVFALDDALEFSLQPSEAIRITDGVRLVTKERPERVFKETTLRHITTGEPIHVPETVKPAVRYIVLEGFEKEL